MKKIYLMPEIKVVKMDTSTAFLTGSDYSDEQSAKDATVFSREGRGFGDE